MGQNTCTWEDGLTLSREACSLWGKSDYGLQRAWLPLFVHMADSSAVAFRLWDEWLPRSTKRVLSSFIEEGTARSFFSFIAAVHDVGKATPAFQSQPCWVPCGGSVSSLMWLPEGAGLPFPAGSCDSRGPNHAFSGQVILEQYLNDKMVGDTSAEVSSAQLADARKGARSIASIVGCHHGRSQSSADILNAREIRPSSLGISSEQWHCVQEALIEYSLKLAGLPESDLIQIAQLRVPPQAASILSGALIMCDWMASNTEAFPLATLPSHEYAYADGQDAFDDGAINLNSFFLGATSALDFDYLAKRAERGWTLIGVIPSWSGDPLGSGDIANLYVDRFEFSKPFSPRPVQKAAVEVASTLEEPGLMIIEAPMGEGKTEAALAVAEIVARKVGLGGVCVALPTMATTDAMFARVHRWLEHLPHDGINPQSICLAHGKAKLNEEYQGISKNATAYRLDIDRDAVDGASIFAESDSGVVISDWMCGKKRGMLSNFVVCTVDQVLMGALQMKHLALRQLALANKVVIIDECHAYDMYMRQYLDVVLEWLGSWHVPVILLSATLPAKQKEEMAGHYLAGWTAKRRMATRPRRRVALRVPLLNSEEPKRDVTAPAPCQYPLLTYTRGERIEECAVDGSGKSSEVTLSVMPDDESRLVELLETMLADGGCAGVICDTVTRAQKTAVQLARVFGEDAVTLTHARFIDIDRMENENCLRSMLGPDATIENGQRPYRHIVVGTQVLEQSLDIDFDVLVTDVAPVDLILQRIGRCHRHQRTTRPSRLASSHCYIRGITSWGDSGPAFSSGVSNVYTKASLIEALSVCGLTKAGASVKLALPDDIARLVQYAYSDAVAGVIPNTWGALYQKACQTRLEENQRKEQRAHCCLLKSAKVMIQDGQSLTDWYFLSATDKTDADYGPRAVRDTQETVEVMLLQRNDGHIHLLPWIGDPRHGVEFGAEVPVGQVPDGAVAKLAIQSSARLPLSICSMDRIGQLIEVLEAMDSPYVGSWQESPWLQGQLALFLEDEDGKLTAQLNLGEEGGLWTVSYGRATGLTVRSSK